MCLSADLIPPVIPVPPCVVYLNLNERQISPRHIFFLCFAAHLLGDTASIVGVSHSQ